MTAPENDPFFSGDPFLDLAIHAAPEVVVPDPRSLDAKCEDLYQELCKPFEGEFDYFGFNLHLELPLDPEADFFTTSETFELIESELGIRIDAERDWEVDLAFSLEGDEIVVTSLALPASHDPQAWLVFQRNEEESTFDTFLVKAGFEVGLNWGYELEDEDMRALLEAAHYQLPFRGSDSATIHRYLNSLKAAATAWSTRETRDIIGDISPDGTFQSTRFTKEVRSYADVGHVATTVLAEIKSINVDGDASQEHSITSQKLDLGTARRPVVSRQVIMPHDAIETEDPADMPIIEVVEGLHSVLAPEVVVELRQAVERATAGQL